MSLRVKVDISLSDIKRLDLYAKDAIEISKTKLTGNFVKRFLKKLSLRLQLYFINFRCLKMVCENKYILPMPYNVNKLGELMKQAGLAGQDEKRDVDDNATKGVENIVWFFTANLGQTPLDIEKGFRQKDIIPTFNQIINKNIENYINMALAYHDPKQLFENVKKIQWQIKQSEKNQLGGKDDEREERKKLREEEKPFYDGGKNSNLQSIGSFVVAFRGATHTL